MRLSLRLLVLGIAFLTGAPWCWANGSARVLVVDSVKSKLSPELNARVRAVVGAAVGKAGLGEVVGTGAAPCGGSECLMAAGAAAGATHVAWVEAWFRDESYAFSIEVWEVAGKRSLVSDARECAICATQDLLDALATRAQTLFTRVPPTLVASPAPSVSPVASLPAPTTPEPPPSPWLRPIALIGVGVGLVGVGLGVAGLYYIAEDGKRVSDNSIHVRNTRTAGVILGVSGAVAFAAGVGLVTWNLFDTTTIALSPQGLTLAGRF